MGAMHFANIAKSIRLQKTLKYLQKLKRATTFEIARHTKGVAIGTDIAELRANGYDIRCHYSHKNNNGNKIYIYTYWGKK